MKKIILMLLVCCMHGVVVGQERKHIITLNDSDIIENKFTYVNAINFDFGESSKSNSTTYLGHLNYFFNLLKESEKSNHYINTGLLKSNYYSSEVSKGSLYQFDNVLESPNNPTTPGSPYIKEYNKYDFDVKLKTYSAYLQWLYRFSKVKNLFIHLHGEMLITNFDTSIKVETISKSNEILPNNNIIPVTQYLVRDNNFSKQNIGAYFGSGLTLKTNFFSYDDTNIDYFLQGTVGYSSTKLNPKLIPRENQIPQYENQNEIKPFYLIHSYFENDISGIRIIVGTYIRANFSEPQLYNFYLGLNTNLDNLKKIFE